MQYTKTEPLHLSFILLHINLVAQYHKREVLRIMWACLDEELVSPAIERLERLGAVDVVDKDTAVCSTVECYTEGLETFLSGGVPKLVTSYAYLSGAACIETGKRTDLHRDETIVHHNFFCQAAAMKHVQCCLNDRMQPLYAQVCTNSRLVLVAKPLIHILIHKGCLSDTV